MDEAQYVVRGSVATHAQAAAPATAQAEHRDAQVGATESPVLHAYPSLYTRQAGGPRNLEQVALEALVARRRFDDATQLAAQRPIQDDEARHG